LSSTLLLTLLMTVGLVFLPAGRQQGPHHCLWDVHSPPGPALEVLAVSVVACHNGLAGLKTGES